MENTLGFELDKIDEYYGFYSSGRYQVCDLYIIKPSEGNYDYAKDFLEGVRFQRISDFERYDVLNSLEIAESSSVYSYGEYLILIIMEDSEQAQKIIEENISSN